MTDLLSRLQPALADRYAVERELGSGGMATVYLARDLKHDREVALKVLRPDLAAVLGTERFLQEIRITARLDHPHILTVIDSGESEGFLWYVLPYVRGESLRARLNREKQLSVEAALAITRQIGGALQYAHRQGVIHRDLKPENILLFEGEAMLADFGIALAAKEAGGNRLTETGISLGTPQYMSPEQATGTKQLDGRTDIYSLGCVLYEMLAGHPPFTGATAQAIIARVLVDSPPPLRTVRETVTSGVAQAVAKALAKVPADRFASAGDFVMALSAVQPDAAVQRRERPGVPAGVLWLLGLLILAGGGLAVWGLVSRSEPTTPVVRNGVATAFQRVAVRYFQDLSSAQDLGYLADGLTEALIDTLRRAKTVEVISREGMRQYRDPKISRDSLAGALEVTTLVDGTVDRAGGLLQATFWVIDAGSGRESERRSIEASPEDVLGLRDRIVQEGPKLIAEARPIVSSAGLERRGAAWTLVQQAERARQEAEAATDTNAALRALERADALLGRAEPLSSDWVEPIASRGWIAFRRARLTQDLPKKALWLEAGLGHAARALRIDAQDPKSLELRGTLRHSLWRTDATMEPQRRAALLDSARTDLEAATVADPNLASAYATLSFLYYDLKDVFTALNRGRQAIAADKYLSTSNSVLARLFFSAYDTEQFSEAAKWCNEGGHRFPNDYRFTECRLWLMLVPDARPSVDDAWRLALRIDSLAPASRKALRSHHARMLVGGVIGMAARAAHAGPREVLMDSARKVLVRARGDQKVDPTQELVGYEAVMRTQIGDYDDAIKLLKQYLASNPRHSFRVGPDPHWWWRELEHHPEFRTLQR